MAANVRVLAEFGAVYAACHVPSVREDGGSGIAWTAYSAGVVRRNRTARWNVVAPPVPPVNVIVCSALFASWRTIVSVFPLTDADLTNALRRASVTNPSFGDAAPYRLVTYASGCMVIVVS